jgi:mono/diheme cytochrome c family protein
MRAALFLVLATALTACTHDKPNFIYMPDMVYSPAYKAQKQGEHSMLPPVPGTVPRDFQAYRFPTDPKDFSGGGYKNPIRRTKAVLGRGQFLFNTYCIVCHGPNGEGDGPIIPKFPRPPTLQSDIAVGYADAYIFQLTSIGRANMPGYASQISAEDRWAVVHYVRALQRSKHPTPDDLRVAGK